MNSPNSTPAHSSDHSNQKARLLFAKYIKNQLFRDVGRSDPGCPYSSLQTTTTTPSIHWQRLIMEPETLKIENGTSFSLRIWRCNTDGVCRLESSILDVERRKSNPHTSTQNHSTLSRFRARRGRTRTNRPRRAQSPGRGHSEVDTSADDLCLVDHL